MSIDLDAILRQLKPEKHRRQLKPDDCMAVVPIDRLPDGPIVLVPDTVVYVALAARQDTVQVASLISRAIQYHSAVALSELAQGLAHYDPASPGFAAVRRHYTDLFHAIPPSRIITPDDDVWMRAAIITGVLSRTQCFQPHQRKELFADALIFLSASKFGLPVLTRNVKDFALISQVHGSGRIVTF